MEFQSFDGFIQTIGYLAMLILANAGNSGHFPTGGDLRFHNSAGAKRVSTVQRQAVIENMENARHGPNPCHKRINVASTRCGYNAAMMCKFGAMGMEPR
jgi:hypothetical protein